MNSELFSKIRVEFLFEHPFLSVLALSLPTTFVSKNRETLFSTNGKEIFIDDSLLDSYSKDEVKYLYAHLLIHIILKHPFRMETREPKVWNLACDIAINLIMHGFKNVGKKPLNQPFDERFINKSTEEIYETLYKESRETPINTENSNDLIVNSFDGNDISEIEKELDTLIIQAINIAKNSGTMTNLFYKEIEEVLEIKIDIKELLREYLTLSFFEKKSSFATPNRRYIHKKLYLPSPAKTKEQIRLYIALDMSSSVEIDEYRRFLGLLEEMSENFYEFGAKVLPFDSEVKKDLILEFDSFSPLLPELLRVPKSDGGTNIDSVFEYIQKDSGTHSRNLLLVLSDGYFEIKKPIETEILFLLTEKKNLKKHERYGRCVYYDKRA